MFAPRFTVPVGELVIEMGPPKRREDVEVFAELMSSPKVSRYLGRAGGYAIEDETDWYDKTRTDKNHWTWFIYDVTDGKRELIGTTGYGYDHGQPLKTAASGFQLARPEYWGRGIAKTTHRVRTWHAFAREGVISLRSAVFEPNVGSRKALESIGYVVVSKERNQTIDNGQYVSKLNLECINPDRYTWAQWWHGDRVPTDFRNARTRTIEALAWVHEHVRPLD